nr:MAG TPA: hypothetical protein [Caudoviricetes sp.]
MDKLIGLKPFQNLFGLTFPTTGNLVPPRHTCKHS